MTNTSQKKSLRQIAIAAPSFGVAIAFLAAVTLAGSQTGSQRENVISDSGQHDAAMGLGVPPPQSGPAAPAPPKRVVSMNLCTDQLAMLIAGPGQLVSISNLTSDPFLSSMSREAAKYHTNSGAAEDIFLLKPDLIIAGRYTTRETVQLLRRLGFRVEMFDLATSFDTIRSNIARMGELLGRRRKAADILSQFDQRLARLTANMRMDFTPTAVMHHANSYTSGKATLSHDVLAMAGVRNLGREFGVQGIARLPLELLVMGGPDLILTDRPWDRAPSEAQRTFEHPALRALEAKGGIIAQKTKAWVCGTPHILDAVAEVRRLVDRVALRRGAPGSRDKQQARTHSSEIANPTPLANVPGPAR